MAKAAFWQNKELMRRNIRFKIKMKILNCFLFSILNYGCESWTWNKEMRKKVNAFEMWCYRRILKIRWKDRVRNVEILRRLQTRYHFVEDMMKRKMKYAGHVLRGSSGLTHLTDISGLCGGKKKSWCTEKSVDEGCYGLDRSEKIYNGEASSGGESELEAHSCQPSLSTRR